MRASLSLSNWSEEFCQDLASQVQAGPGPEVECAGKRRWIFSRASVSLKNSNSQAGVSLFWQSSVTLSAIRSLRRISSFTRRPYGRRVWKERPVKKNKQTKKTKTSK